MTGSFKDLECLVTSVNLQISDRWSSQICVTFSYALDLAISSPAVFQWEKVFNMWGLDFFATVYYHVLENVMGCCGSKSIAQPRALEAPEVIARETACKMITSSFGFPQLCAPGCASVVAVSWWMSVCLADGTGVLFSELRLVILVARCYRHVWWSTCHVLWA